MNIKTTELLHYGMPRRSGRYPWGSGENPYQDRRSFMANVTNLRKKGLSDTEIAKGLGMTTSEFRAKVSLAKSENRQADISEAIRLKDKGYSISAISERLGISEGSVRNYLKPDAERKEEVAFATADVLKEELTKHPYLDIGVGSEAYLGVSRTRLKTAVELLKEQGYETKEIYVEQLGTGKQTTVLVLCKEGTDIRDIYNHRDEIVSPKGTYSEDGGETFKKVQPPTSISSSRIQIVYAEQGGSDKDGLLELREGVEDLSLGQSRYAQVRVGVDGTHYMKGMAVYSDDMPAGIDVRYYTKKSVGTPADKVFKEMDLEDPDNPFGAAITRQNGAINIVNEEGSWYDWSRTLSSQMLSKQSVALAEKQLGIAYDVRDDEFSEIQSLTNPSVRRFFMSKFADGCDSDAVHLKAAAMPRQSTNVILPIPSLAEDEVYAPMYRDGERVALIRYPHGGTFEIADVKVNNKNQEAKRVLGSAKDAIGINAAVAMRLSGADFDGDSVIVIPNAHGKIVSTPLPEALKNFDPQMYKLPDAAPRIAERTKNIKMGDVSNLITDMTIRGAPPNDIAMAVRHSMVVIDSYKHHLDYKQSYVDHHIAELKAKYQGSSKSGASTLISKAASEKEVPERKEGQFVRDPVTGSTRLVYVDPVTGNKLYRETGATKGVYVKNKDGSVKVDAEGKKVVVRKPKTSTVYKMADEEDAYKLSSGSPMENVYAAHANKLKALARKARLEVLATKPTPYSPSAARVYSEEVASLSAKLKAAIANKPLERQAQLIANAIVAAKYKDNPDMSTDKLKKVRSQALQTARARTGAAKSDIKVTAKEWDAIQAGAITPTRLEAILSACDTDVLRTYALPKEYNGLAPAKLRRAQVLIANGYTQAQVADALDVSVSTLMRSLETS